MVKRKSENDRPAKAAPPHQAKATGKAAPTDAGDEKAPVLGKKDLLALLATDLDLSKKDIRKAMEALLAALGEALAKGHSLNLPPLGKARVARTKGEGAAQSLTVKLRAAGLKNSAKGRKQPLAEGGEDS